MNQLILTLLCCFAIINARWDGNGTYLGNAVQDRNRDGCFMSATDFHGADLSGGRRYSVSSPEKCQKICQETDGCNVFTWHNKDSPHYGNNCFLKYSRGKPYTNKFTTSGPSSCSGCFTFATDFYGADLSGGRRYSVSSPEKCQKICQETNGCNVFTWHKKDSPHYGNNCFLKYGRGKPYTNKFTTSGPSSCGGCFTYATDFYGADLSGGRRFSVSSPDDCRKICQGTNGCNFFTWHNKDSPHYGNNCFLKYGRGKPYTNKFTTSGPSSCSNYDSYEFAWAHRPYLRFDGKAGDQNKCFPDYATDNNNNKCHGFNKNAPIYYRTVRCGDFLKLVWHFWYGWQTGCTAVDKGHNNDWERIIINFKLKSGSWVQDSVTFYQHAGWYTRANTQTNPSIWVGKTSHGSYDMRCDGKSWWHSTSPSYCAGGCGYWEDFRNDNENSRWLPHNILPVSAVTGAVSRQYGSNAKITEIKYFDKANKHACHGAHGRVIWTSGCWRNSHTFPAPICNDK